MNKARMLHGSLVVLVMLTLGTAACTTLREKCGRRQRLDAALRQEGWKLTKILQVDQYLDFDGTMVVEAAMHCPAWSGQLRFCMGGRRLTVQDMRDEENTPEEKKHQLLPGSPQALHLAAALTDFIPRHPGREAVNAVLLREVLCGSRNVRGNEWWKTWVTNPGREQQRMLRKLETTKRNPSP